MNICKYNFYMNILVICLFLIISSINAFADIDAIWEAKNIQAKLATSEFDNVEYVSLSNLTRFLGANHVINTHKGIGVINLENGEITYTHLSPYVSVGEKSYNLQSDIIFYQGDYYAPVETIIEVIDRLISDDIVYSRDDHILYVKPATYNILDLTARQKLNGLMVEILLSEELKYDIVQTDDHWLIANIYQGKIDTLLFNGKRPLKAIYDTKAYQFENSAQISIRLRPKPFTFISKLKENPLRIQMMIKGDDFADTVLSYIPGEKHNNNINVIVLDPGHGGEDDGAVGPSGTKEKDINLKISKKLKQMLENEGFDVILTRDDDRFVTLSDRTKIANEAGADIFISIHCNASATNKNARGYISFFLSDAKSDQARATAALENAAIRFETKDNQRDYVSDIDFILLDMVQSEYLKESADLAEVIEQNITRNTKIESRGTDQAGFFVLNKAFMPSVLVESAFISNKKDEKLLKNSKTQENIARSIASAIVQFKQKYEAME